MTRIAAADPATIALVFLAALAIALLATPLAGRLGRRLGIVDVPGGRRTHIGAITRIGGVGLFAGFFLTALGLFAAGVYKPEHRLPLTGVLLGSAFEIGRASCRERVCYAV